MKHVNGDFMHILVRLAVATAGCTTLQTLLDENFSRSDLWKIYPANFKKLFAIKNFHKLPRRADTDLPEDL